MVDVFGSFPNIARGEVHGEVFEIHGRDYYDRPGAQNVALDASNEYDGYNANDPLNRGNGGFVGGNQFYTVLNGDLVQNVQSPTAPGSCIV